MQLKSREGRGGYLEDISADHLVVGPEPLLEITCNYKYTPDPQGVPAQTASRNSATFRSAT